MQNRRFVTIPKKFVQGKEKSYTGYDFLLICPPSEAGLPSCVLEVPEFLAEEAPGGGLTIFEGTMPFLCRRKDPPKGTRSKRYRWIVDEIEVVYAREIAEMDRAREKRAERRLAALRGPGALVVAWHNELDSVDSGVAFFRKGLSVGLVPAGSKWMYDLDSYDPWSPSGTKGRHGRGSAAYREVESIPVPDVASALEGREAFRDAAYGMAKCHSVLASLDGPGSLFKKPKAPHPQCFGELFTKDVQAASRAVEEAFESAASKPNSGSGRQWRARWRLTGRTSCQAFCPHAGKRTPKWASTVVTGLRRHSGGRE